MKYPKLVLVLVLLSACFWQGQADVDTSAVAEELAEHMNIPDSYRSASKLFFVHKELIAGPGDWEDRVVRPYLFRRPPSSEKPHYQASG